MERGDFKDFCGIIDMKLQVISYHNCWQLVSVATAAVQTTQAASPTTNHRWMKKLIKRNAGIIKLDDVGLSFLSFLYYLVIFLQINCVTAEYKDTTLQNNNTTLDNGGNHFLFRAPQKSADDVFLVCKFISVSSVIKFADSISFLFAPIIIASAFSH